MIRADLLVDKLISFQSRRIVRIEPKLGFLLDRLEADVHFVWMAQKHDRTGLNLAGHIWVINRLFYADEGAHVGQCRELDVHEASFFRVGHGFYPVVARIVRVEALRLHCLRDAGQRQRNSRLCAAP